MSLPTTITKVAASPNVLVGDPIIFTVEFKMDDTVTISNFTDSLPTLPSGAPWTIQAQNPPNTFQITGSNLTVIPNLPHIPAGTYNVTVQAIAGIADLGTSVVNSASVGYFLHQGGPIVTIDASASVNVPLITLTKSTTSTNVAPGNPINFEIKLVIDGVVGITTFTDPLPVPSGGPWQITAENPVNFFQITGSPGTQFLEINPMLIPGIIALGTYSATIEAKTNINDAGSVFTNEAKMDYTIDDETSSTSSSAQATVAVCIHKSSMILLADGGEIGISELKPGQEIMSADGNVSALIEAVPCWTVDNDNVSTHCVIFEQNSLGPGVPSKRFAVDHGHPIATQEEYLKNGNKSLRPAVTYLNNNNTIYCTIWSEVASLLPGENRRFDIIMKDDSCKAYIANGIVVQARQNRKDPGYEYVSNDLREEIILNVPVLTFPK